MMDKEMRIDLDEKRQAFAEAQVDYATEGPALPVEQIEAFAGPLLEHRDKPAPFDAILASLQLTEQERFSVGCGVDAEIALRHDSSLLDHDLFVKFCGWPRPLPTGVRLPVGRALSLRSRIVSDLGGADPDKFCYVEAMTEAVLLEEATWNHLVVVSNCGNERVAAAEIYLAHLAQAEKMAGLLGLEWSQYAFPSGVAWDAISTDQTIRPCCDRRRELEERIRQSGEPWEHLDGWVSHSGYFNAERVWRPPLMCWPCFGEYGPYGASYRHAGHLRCYWCLEYSLEVLTLEERRRELRTGQREGSIERSVYE